MGITILDAKPVTEKTIEKMIEETMEREISKVKEYIDKELEVVIKKQNEYYDKEIIIDVVYTCKNWRVPRWLLSAAKEEVLTKIKQKLEETPLTKSESEAIRKARDFSLNSMKIKKSQFQKKNVNIWEID